MIIIDNGPEFVRKALDTRTHRNGMKLTFKRPEKRLNHIENFKGRLQGMCLNVSWFMSQEHAREDVAE